jgi:ABC-type antimicrobial peptide transport system, ATPase component
MIEFKDVTFFYDHKPLMQHFSCCIARGEKVVLFGPSGKGKSTLLASIPGFVRPDEGRIEIDGKELTGSSVTSIRQRIAWLPQEFTLPYDTVRETIEAPFRLRANRRNMPARETVLDHFERLGLEAVLYDKRNIEISGGQRQRIMLMIAALLGKEIVLLDEPTSALDPESVERVIRYIRSLESATVVMVSHDRRVIGAFDREIGIGIHE